MKRKISKIFGVGLALVLALALTVPLMAATVITQPTVSIPSADDDISDTDVTYSITFQINNDIEEADAITIKFPDDTVISAVGDTDITISVTSGIQSEAGEITEADEGLTTAVSGRTLTITLDNLDQLDAGGGAGDIIGRLSWVEVKVADVDNPTEAGDYTLQVKTTDESTWVESAVYTIATPEVGGSIYVYNDADVLLATYGGTAALNDCEDDGHFDSEDYTIKVGPGDFVITANDPISIGGEGVTLISTDGNTDTLIDAGESGVNPAFLIRADDVTIDGFTIDDAVGDAILINYATDGVTVQNCIITDAVNSGIVLNWDSNAGTVVDSATVTGNLVEDCGAGINLLGSALDCTISNNTITESSNESLDFHGGTSSAKAHGNKITGNIITGNETMGIRMKADGSSDDYFDETVISGNTISDNEGDGIQILANLNNITGLVIMGNTIADNDDDGIIIGTDSWSDSCLIAFNNITGNDDDAIDNNAGTTVHIDAILNWWGTDVSGDIDTEFEGDYSNDDWDPYLTAAVDAIFSGYHADAREDDIDGEDECGVLLTNVEADETTEIADRLKVAKYIVNPEGKGASGTPVAYYDVYVALDDEAVTAITEISATLKLYASGVDEDTSKAYVWSTVESNWVLCSSQLPSEYGGYVRVTLEDDTTPAIDDLSGTTFVVTQKKPTDLNTPVLEFPDYGDEDVSLNPQFAWKAVDDADSYVLQVADNAFFAKATEKSPLSHTVWKWEVALGNSATLYWRVKAKNDDGAESEWAEAVFTTKAASVAPPAPPAVLYNCPTCGLSFKSPSELQKHWGAVHVPPPPAPAPPPPGLALLQIS